MCYEFDSYILKARIAEQLRKLKPMEKKPANEPATAAPTTGGEPAKEVERHEPITA